MANSETIKTTIDANINTNGNQEITGAVMNSVLKQMVDSTDVQLAELKSKTNTQLSDLANEIETLQTEMESQSVLIEDLQDNKADRGGYEPDLSVGVADHLASHDEPTPSEFTFRKSGGGAILSGNARVQSVKGNSVVWNQLINNILSDTTYQKAWYPRRGVNYASVQNGEIELRFDSQYDAFGNSLRQQIDVRPGDKIYTSYDYESHNVDEFGRRVYMAFTAGWSSKATLGDNCLAKGGEVVGHAEGFSVVPSDNSIDTLCIYFCYTNIASPDTTPLKIANFRFVNLTRMFGAGNEPTTIEDFYSRIPQGIDTNAYNEGEVIHMNVDAVKSVGDNAWDEKWESGYINPQNGADTPAEGYIRPQGMIRILPDTTYYMVKPQGKYVGILYYDINGNFMGDQDAFATSGTGGNFKTFKGAHFMRFYCHISTYNHDICINISDTEKSGTYRPYVSRKQSLDILSKYFPQGMKSAGTAHDEIRYNNTTQKWEKVQRIGVVDLGTLQWSYGDSTMHLSASVQDLAIESDYYERLNGVICSLYPADTQIGINTNARDKSIKRYQKTIYIRDSSYTDAASFKTAMAGVILYYELAEPIVTEIEEAFNLDYEVWNGGTEQAIADTPTSAFKADIIYGFNAYGVIKELREQLATLQAAIAKFSYDRSNQEHT